MPIDSTAYHVCNVELVMGFLIRELSLQEFIGRMVLKLMLDSSLLEAAKIFVVSCALSGTLIVLFILSLSCSGLSTALLTVKVVHHSLCY